MARPKNVENLEDHELTAFFTRKYNSAKTLEQLENFGREWSNECARRVQTQALPLRYQEAERERLQGLTVIQQRLEMVYKTVEPALIQAFLDDVGQRVNAVGQLEHETVAKVTDLLVQAYSLAKALYLEQKDLTTA